MTQTRERTASAQIPSLDLLRSWAIASVVLAHACLAYGVGPALAPLQLGGTGVDLFFLLSGWLLGSQLMRELKATGSIRLMRFWSRRWMRTLPAYYAVLFFTFGQQMVKGNYDLDWSFLWFGQNYFSALPYFTVSWSLCVEEHFYLAIAPFSSFVFSLGRRGVLLGAAVLLVPFVSRTLGLYGHLEQTHVRYDACLAGVALAAINVFLPGAWRRLCAAAPLIGGVGAVLYSWFVFARWHPAYTPPLDEPTQCIIIYGSILLLAVSSEKWRRALYVPGSAYLAKRAYAVYLLHPESLALMTRLHLPSFPLFLALSWVVTLGAAEVLYRVVELPIMNARERYRFSASGHHAAAPSA
ncbi:MAG TPA: acyltransferase [Vicinamibacterales bacterium]|nr:acyltransferase [Vicinamibacterales bacterium]